MWHPKFLDFARYWGFTPRLCAPYRAQTKGKVESGIKYVRRNFLCGLLSNAPSTLADLNGQMKAWVWTVANQRIQGTIHEQPVTGWEIERKRLRSTAHRPPYPYADDELRRVARDAYVAWQGSRYSAPWQYAGKEVWVHERADRIEVHYRAERIAVHERAGRHRVVTHSEHHRGIWPGSHRRSDKIVIHLRETPPVVEARSLAAYGSLADGGAR